MVPARTMLLGMEHKRPAVHERPAVAALQRLLLAAMAERDSGRACAEPSSGSGAGSEGEAAAAAGGNGSGETEGEEEEAAIGGGSSGGPLQQLSGPARAWLRAWERADRHACVGAPGGGWTDPPDAATPEDAAMHAQLRHAAAIAAAAALSSPDLPTRMPRPQVCPWKMASFVRTL